MAMRALLASAILLSSAASAEVRELDGEEMLDTYVQGISISQAVTDKPFDTDGEQLREGTEREQALLGDVPDQVRVQNAEALDQPPALDDLLAGVTNATARDALQDSLYQGPRITHLDLSIQRAAAEANIAEPSQPDVSAFEGTLFELLPSSTGYELEFANRGF